jgi:ketosteroid isomerase-like protein
MSNADIGARVVEAFNAGDVEAALDAMHPEIEFIPMRAPIQGAYHGHAGIRKFFADNEENFETFHITTDEVHEIDDVVVGIGTLRVRGKGSGVEVTVPTAVVVTFSEGKIVHFEEFGDRDRALTAAAGRSAE